MLSDIWNGILIVSMNASHVDAVRDIEREAGFTICSGSYWMSEIASLRSRAFVAELKEGRKVIGYIHAWFLPEEMQITEVAVRPQMRRKGVATELMVSMMRQAREEGKKRAYLEVRAGNAAALRLYEKMGFVIRGRRERYYERDGEDALLMEATI